MNELPPVETPVLVTGHLRTPSLNDRRWPSFSFSRRLLILPLAVIIPATLLWMGQPAPPRLTAQEKLLTSDYLAQSGRTPDAVAQVDTNSETSPGPTSPSPSPNAQLASTTGN